jgi:hypothetical protein
MDPMITHGRSELVVSVMLMPPTQEMLAETRKAVTGEWRSVDEIMKNVRWFNSKGCVHAALLYLWFHGEVDHMSRCHSGGPRQMYGGGVIPHDECYKSGCCASWWMRS